MQVPAGRPKLALMIKALAEHPVAMPVLILDAVIVARSRKLGGAFAPSLCEEGV
jgi:hypothetical protein